MFITISLFAKDTLSKNAYKKLQKAQTLVEKKELNKAIQILEPLLELSKNNGYQKSFVLQEFANIYIEKQNYKKVATFYEEIISINKLPPEAILNMRFSLARIYLSLDKFKKSISIFNALLKDGFKNKSLVYENLALAHYYDKNYKKTIKYTKIVLKNKNKENELWYQILYSSYIELKDYKNSIKTMKILVKIKPKKENYWIQLASLYQTVKKDKKALGVLEMAHVKGILSKENNILFYINLLLQNEVYNKSAMIVQEYVKKGDIKFTKRTFEILLSSFVNAKEYKNAIITLEKNKKYALEFNYQYLLANLEYNNKNFSKSINVLKNSKKMRLSKKELGKVDILIALNYFEKEDKKASIIYFKKALKNRYSKKRAKTIIKDLGIRI